MKPRIRIRSISEDGCPTHTKIMNWDDKEQVWVTESIIVGDFDMAFDGTISYATSFEIQEKTEKDETSLPKTCLCSDPNCTGKCEERMKPILGDTDVSHPKKDSVPLWAINAVKG